MKKLLPIIIVIIIIVGLGIWWQVSSYKTPPLTIGQVTNFNECVAAGGPVMESYPRQCRYGDKTFVEEVKPAPTN
jgi:hypothetical protein